MAPAPSPRRPPRGEKSWAFSVRDFPGPRGAGPSLSRVTRERFIFAGGNRGAKKVFESLTKHTLAASICYARLALLAASIWYARLAASLALLLAMLGLVPGKLLGTEGINDNATASDAGVN